MARDLGKTIGEIEQMPNREFMAWLTLYQIEREEQQEAALDAKLEARAARGAR